MKGPGKGPGRAQHRIPRFRERGLNPALRRLRQLSLRFVKNRFVHRHRVRRVRLGSRDYKRIRFGDAWTAAAVAEHLERFESSGLFPAVEARFDDELLLEFVDGARLDAFDATTVDPMARFYAALYRPAEQEGAKRRLEDTRFARDALRDLRFLRDVGVVEAGRLPALERALAALAPAQVYVGFDYTDAVPKNFVRRTDGLLVGVDAGALQAGALVGTGVAKSLARGDASYQAGFLDAFATHSDLPLAPAMPFVELCFRAAWLKRLYLKGSARRLEPDALERFL